ncbi:MAG: oligoribonuclease [Acidimicrobiia bacterium]
MSQPETEVVTTLSADDSAPSEVMVWVDLEMTGLDVRTHTIVEIAIIATDADLKPLDDGLDLVIRAEDADLEHIDPFVYTMHKRSGLLKAIEASTTSLVDAGTAALEYVKGHVGPGIAPMCGNSIGVDRRFLDAYLPELDQYLHYRSVDVSSLKELCRRWKPAEYARRPSKRGSHRALDDILESIAELTYYRSVLFSD